MRNSKASLLVLGFIFLTMGVGSSARAESPKEWTFLVYLNGKNSLDSYGKFNINQMEEVGSTDQINVVVQWASSENKTTKRLLVKKDTNTNLVTSPVIQDMGKVDMGDYKTLIEFIKWGAANYPAKHYFVDVWDHGSGWHNISSLMSPFGSFTPPYAPNDISWDDETGNFMTTKQLGQALKEGATIIGHKIDVYGSDACLMAMAEVASEMADSVDVSVGSEETEPGAGWPYNTFLKSWSEKIGATAADVGKILTTEYVKSYQGGVNGSSQVTFSSFDLSKLGAVQEAVKTLGEALSKLSSSDRKKVVTAGQAAQSFYYSDYVDLFDFMNKLEKSNITALSGDIYALVKTAASQMVIANADTTSYSSAGGLAIWLPSSSSDYSYYAEKYKQMNFDQATGWGKVLATLLAAR